MKICPNPSCLTDNLDTAVFCKICATPLQQSAGRTCPSGRHTMDPSWTECMYCKQQNIDPAAASPGVPGRAPTVVEGQAPPARPVPPPRPVAADGPLPPRQPGVPLPPPRVQPQGQAVPPRNKTVFDPNAGRTEEQRGVAPPPVARARKIVGVLISYSWVPEGKIFPVLEGRNLIGRDQECEVCIPEDKSMSGRNSHVTWRDGSFTMGDLVSMTGTSLNGKDIQESFHRMDNYATIRAGSTYFTFIAVTPAESGTSAAESAAGNPAVGNA
jgi:hypothetical protein